MNAVWRLCLPLLATACLAAPREIEPWRAAFVGVDIAEGRATAVDARPQRAIAVRIDLRAPGIEFVSTEGNGDAPGETDSETATAFARRHHAQVAINANLFSPCCGPGGKDLGGLALSAGKIVSPPVRHGPGDCVLAITRDNRAVITRSDPSFKVEDYWTAVAGTGIIVKAGRNVAASNDTGGDKSHPRTAVGLDADGRQLFLLVIDGRRPGRSEGATLVELADWLVQLGAHEALNLDGGGSTTLVVEERSGPEVRNEPADGGWLSTLLNPFRGREAAQRPNGNHLGIRARPMAER
ncbi:MAG: phosphodiester glycosidase family protein [Opitutaceae bacterium]